MFRGQFLLDQVLASKFLVVLFGYIVRNVRECGISTGTVCFHVFEGGSHILHFLSLDFPKIVFSDKLQFVKTLLLVDVLMEVSGSAEIRESRKLLAPTRFGISSLFASTRDVSRSKEYR